MDLGSGPAINVRDHGALGDGQSDDTDAIHRAFSTSGGGGTVYFPPGTYRYNGPGIDSPPSPSIFGASALSAKVLLGSDSYFLRRASFLENLVLSGLTFEGGKGVISHTYSGVNVAGQFLVQNCQFHDYTECAISTDSSDMPYWRIANCIFNAQNTVDTIGIALSPGTDQCVIESCSFIRNRIHIKARRGNNFHIARCDLLQFSTENSGGPRVAVWVVPDSIAVNAGTGLTVTGCKFGNENLLPGDMRILYADERGGNSNGTRYPELDADSTSYVAGQNIAFNAIYGTGSDSHPIIYSTTPNVRALHVHSNALEGGQPSYVVEFRTPPSNPDRITANSVFGPFIGGSATENSLPFPASNVEGLAYWDDPQGLQQRANTIRNWTSGSSASFRELLAEGVAAFVSDRAVTKSVADAFGGADAVQFTMHGATSTLSHSLAVPFVAGMPMWVEFDVASPSDGTAASKFFVSVGDGASNYHWRRCIEVPSADMGWVSYAFAFTPRTTGQTTTNVVFAATGESEVGQTVNIGRPRVYQSNERQLGGRRPFVADAATNEGEALILVNELRNKLIELGLVSGRITKIS